MEDKSTARFKSKGLSLRYKDVSPWSVIEENRCIINYKIVSKLGLCFCENASSNLQISYAYS